MQVGQCSSAVCVDEVRCSNVKSISAFIGVVLDIICINTEGVRRIQIVRVEVQRNITLCLVQEILQSAIYIQVDAYNV